MELKCNHCNHIWETKSGLVLVTCPSCHLKVKNTNSDTNHVNNPKQIKRNQKEN